MTEQFIVINLDFVLSMQNYYIQFKKPGFYIYTNYLDMRHV